MIDGVKWLRALTIIAGFIAVTVFAIAVSYHQGESQTEHRLKALENSKEAQDVINRIVANALGVKIPETTKL